MNYQTTMFVLSQIRKFSTSKIVSARKNYYESLGLTKTATQADVKGAYYQLTKVYHPDKNQGHNSEEKERHAQKFRDITEAYEVLGNVKTRRMYDKGFIGEISHSTHSTTPEDPLHKFYKSRETRHRPPPPGGRVPIYDFDEWSKQHYSHAFRRSQEMKQRHELHDRMEAKQEYGYEMGRFVYGGLLFILLCMGIKNADKCDLAVFFGAHHRYKYPELYNKDYVRPKDQP